MNLYLKVDKYTLPRIKQFLTSASIFLLFNPEYKIKLAYDASHYGINGVISHILPNREERLIA